MSKFKKICSALGKDDNNITINLLILIVFLFASISYVTAIVRLVNYTVDDAFITFRYSHNLASGYGPNWNQNGSRNEGYTSFLWMLLTAVNFIDQVMLAKILNILFSFFTMILIGLSVRKLLLGYNNYIRRFLSILAPSLYAVYPFSAVHASSGMETALATLLFTLLGYVSINIENKKSVLFPIIAFLLGITRPEANVASVGFLLTNYFLSSKSLKPSVMSNIIIFYLLPGAIYFLWRFQYYELLFPLPFYIKASSYAPMGLVRLFSFFRQISYFALLLLPAFIRFKRTLLPIIVASVFWVIYLVFPNHIMGYGHRFFHPTIPVIVILSAYGAANILTWLRCVVGRKVLLILQYLLAVSLLLPAKNDNFDTFIYYGDSMKNAHIFLGRVLNNHLDKNNLLVISDAGAVPFYSGWQTLDSYGLNDKHIALTKSHSPAYIFSFRPTIIVLLSKERELFNARIGWENDIYNECFDVGYTKQGVLKFNESYYLWILGNPNNSIVQDVFTELDDSGLLYTPTLD